MAIPAEVKRVFDEWDANGRPPQPTIAWQRDRWVERYDGLSATFNALPDQLNRTNVRAIVLGKPATMQGMFDAMVATYAWGWSMTRVGIERAATVLNAATETVGAKLLAVRHRLLADGPLEGYRALARSHRIVGLGPALGTKFLYFCSAADDRALIIDQLVAKWLRCRTPLTVAGNRWVRRDYHTYLGTMADWAGQLQIDAHELEELIFGDEARRRKLPGWGE